MSAGASFVQVLKGLLSRLLQKLDQIEKKSPRQIKLRWYRADYHIPPLFVVVITAILFWGLIVWEGDYTATAYTAIGLIVVFLTVLFSLYIRHEFPDLSRSDDAMTLLAVLFLTSVFWIELTNYVSLRFYIVSPYATPVTIGPLLVALLLHPRVGLIVGVVLGLLCGYVNAFSLDVALTGVIGSCVMVGLVRQARTAHHVARAGFLVGVVQALFVLFLAILHSWNHQQTWLGMVSAFVSGIFAIVFGLGTLPFLESFFSRTSSIRLLELADVNHPLLRRMSLEAPGTYHHSMIVANLAADAAAAIGANALLTRAGAYFHDIGKILKADYFIENQAAFGNPHDQVAPSLSKLVITSHVKEGLAIGKSYKLDPMILNFIPEHHGTSQIEYFYQKALKIEEKEEELDKETITEESYRYPGPKPQSRETALVMLADSVEAASRTVEEPNHQRYKDLVYKIINKKLFDNQLDETPLTLRDLHVVADRFIATLVSINHSRIPYPESDKPPQAPSGQRLTPPK